MAIGHVIAVAITGVNRVRICCAVNDGRSEVFTRRYVTAVSKMAISEGFVACTNRAEKVGVRFVMLKLPSNGFLSIKRQRL